MLYQFILELFHISIENILSVVLTTRAFYVIIKRFSLILFFFF